MNSTIPGWLCGDKCTEKFQLRGFPKVDITHFECANCDSLQTQEPIWRSEAYTNSNLSDMDVGAAPADISFPSSDIITGWPASPAHLLCAQLGDSLLFQELPIGQSVRLAQLDGLDSDRWLSNLAAQ